MTVGYAKMVLTKEEFLSEVRRRAGRDAEVGRVLDLPSSRVAELFSGKRGLRYEEAKKLADHFMIDKEETPAVKAEQLEPILSACLRNAPKTGWTDTEIQRLARAVQYGLALITSSPVSADALAVAGQAALLRLREEHAEA